MKWIPVLSLLAVAGIGLTAWSLLARDRGASLPVPTGKPSGAVDPRRAELLQARRSCRMAEIDAAVANLRAATATEAGANDRVAWRLYAEALLERVLLRNHLRGMVPGEPVHAELPAETAKDLDDALAAVAEAKRLGDDGVDVHRIEASLLGNKVTGLAAALQWNGRIQDAIERASQRAANDPALQVAVGLRALLAPKLLGHDPEKALARFEFAAEALPDDERPAVFAAMAALLQKKRQQAIAWLERAVQRNPNNAFARVVLARVRRGDPDAFARDVATAEIEAK